MADFSFAKYADVKPSEKKVVTEEKPKEFSFSQYAEEKPFSTSQMFSDVGSAITESAPVRGLVWLGEKADRYSAAPSRAALGEALSGNIKEIPGAFVKQFGQDPSLAPTKEELYDKTGLPDVPMLPRASWQRGVYEKLTGKDFPTTKDVGGFAIEAGADVANLVSGVGLMKQGARGTMAMAKPVVKGATKAASAAEKAALGTNVVESISETSKNLANSLLKFGKPQILPDAEQTLETAKKLGLEPDDLMMSATYGPKSTVSKFERFITEGPAGQQYQDKYAKTVGKISEAAKQAPQKVGAVLSKDEAGEAIRQSFKEQNKKLFDSIGENTMSQVRNYKPGMTLNVDEKTKFDTLLNSTEKFAKGYVQRGMDAYQRGQGQALLDTVNSLRKSKNYKQSVEQLQLLGDSVFTKNADRFGSPYVRAPQEKLEDLYFGLKDAIINTVEKDIDPGIAKQIKANNVLMSDAFKDRDTLKSILSESTEPHLAYKKAIESGGKNTIEALKSSVSPETFNKLKATYLDSLIKTNADGDVLFSSTIKNIKSKQDALNRMFTADELKDLNDILTLGVRQGADQLSMSGTGASNSFRDFLGGLFSGELSKTAFEKYKQGLLKKAATPQKPPTPAASGLLRAKQEGEQVISDVLKKRLLERNAQTARIGTIPLRDEERDEK